MRIGSASGVLEDLLAGAAEAGVIQDAVLAQNETQSRAFWAVREGQSAAQVPEGPAWKHDVSVPLSRVPDFIAAASDALHMRYPGVRIDAFGHMGDGNIHFDVLAPVGGDHARHGAAREDGARVVHDLIAVFEGSISAEHGLGTMKTAEAATRKSVAEVAALRAIRRALDPKRIMNPRVLF